MKTFLTSLLLGLVLVTSTFAAGPGDFTYLRLAPRISIPDIVGTTGTMFVYGPTGALYISDGTSWVSIQPSALLTAVSHSAYLSGAGTAGSPLTIVNGYSAVHTHATTQQGGVQLNPSAITVTSTLRLPSATPTVAQQVSIGADGAMHFYNSSLRTVVHSVEAGAGTTVESTTGNVSVGVLYGATTNTACEGNDSRLLTAAEKSWTSTQTALVGLTPAVASDVTTVATAAALAASDIVTASAAIATAQSDIVTASAAIGTAQSDIVTASAAIGTAQSDIVTASAAIGTAQSDIVTASAAIGTAQSDIVTASAAIGTAQSDIVTASAAIGTAQSDIVTASAAIGTAQSDIVTASAAIGTAQSDIVTASAAISTAQSDIVTLTATVLSGGAMQASLDPADATTTVTFSTARLDANYIVLLTSTNGTPITPTFSAHSKTPSNFELTISDGINTTATFDIGIMQLP
jgi:hypothetical protein